MGYLLAAVFYRAFVPTTSHGWRSLFWFGAGPPLLIIAFRFMLPETSHFQIMKAEREAKHLEAHLASGREGAAQRNDVRAFAREAWVAVKHNWFLLIYMVVLMAGFNSCSHGSQDFYPTFLKDQIGMSPTQTTVITVIGQIGALLGGTTIGYISSILGRRLTMLLACVAGGALVPAYTFTRGMRLIAPVFFEQFLVGGVWGPIPIHLIELSPPALRALVVGLTYQLGNLASSASATIQGVIGERYPLPSKPDGTKRFDYGRVIAIFMGAVWCYMFVLLFLGPEMAEDERTEMAEEARQFERCRREGLSLAEVGAGRAKGGADADMGRFASVGEKEKQTVEHVEDRDAEKAV